MIRGWYTGASGMLAQEQRLSTIANNLANADRTGFKQDLTLLKSFPEMLLQRVNDQVRRFPLGSSDNAPVVGKLGTGVEVNDVYTDFSQGPLKETGENFDFALAGRGFFVIETAEGLRYSRNGEFTLGKEGWLVTKEGLRVMGEQGPIQLKEFNFRVDRSGSIFYNPKFAASALPLVDENQNDWQEVEFLDRLLLVDFDRLDYLDKQGNSLFRPAFESNVGSPLSGESKKLTGDERPEILWKFLEKPNLNPIAEMVKMIEVQRAYEANQKVVKTADEMVGRYLNEVIKNA